MRTRMTTRVTFLGPLLLLVSNGLCAPWQTASTQARPQAPARLVVPSETRIPLVLVSALSSRTAYVGQKVYCRTVYPVAVNDRILIPVNTYIKGEITQVERPGHVKGKAQIGLRFDSITLPNGVTRSLNATLSNYAGNGKEGFNRTESKITGQGTKGKDAETVGVTAAESASIGAISTISAGRAGLGAATGGAAGGLAGLIYVLATRGKEIVLPRGTSLELELLRPLSFYPDEVGGPEHYPAGPAFERRDPGPGI
ncbi:MAG TPA: hypothetical protein VMX16_06925 [Terriglobia bacterium]|nr:hypothetical protein [Terriglobia bacterium]